MKLRTELSIPTPPRSWTRGERFVALGSCFADTIGQRLEGALFPVTRNPLGVTFSPVALSRQIRAALRGEDWIAADFFRSGGLWRHFDAHSSLASPNRETSLANARAGRIALGQGLSRATVALITLGTAWSYRHKATGLDVAHNHRLPLADFEKRLLSIDECIESLDTAATALRAANPGIEIVVTVSPTRHLRDGLHENNLSKATLLLAARAFVERHSMASYFPAYELLLDDLRDYRFYGPDLTHPNALAIDYIWDKLLQSRFGEGEQRTMSEISSIRDALGHRPSHPELESHQAFRVQILRRIEALETAGLDVNPLRAAYENTDTRPTLSNDAESED